MYVLHILKSTEKHVELISNITNTRTHSTAKPVIYNSQIPRESIKMAISPRLLPKHAYYTCDHCEIRPNDTIAAWYKCTVALEIGKLGAHACYCFPSGIKMPGTCAHRELGLPNVWKINGDFPLSTRDEVPMYELGTNWFSPKCLYLFTWRSGGDGFRLRLRKRWKMKLMRWRNNSQKVTGLLTLVRRLYGCCAEDN